MVKRYYFFFFFATHLIFALGDVIFHILNIFSLPPPPLFKNYTKEVLNMKLNEVQIIICHSVSQYYPLITLLSLCILASYLFKAVVYHSLSD